MMIIAIDGGTTNTRLNLVNDGKIIDKLKLGIGARDGHNELSEAAKKAIPRLIKENGLHESDIGHIALSGMIGSESGLCNIPHITAPAGIDELKKAVVTVEMHDITNLPMCFIPGIKTFSDPKNESLDSLDIMRGEETEIIGTLHMAGLSDDITMLMPGSHMKIVEVRNGRITTFRTSISGELVRAVAENTILKQSIGNAFPKLADTKFLHEGFDYAEKHGINEALFKVRVRANFIGGATGEQLYSFMLGAILRDDVTSVRKTGGKVVIAGSEPFRSALGELTGGELIDANISGNAAAIGAWLITN